MAIAPTRSLGGDMTLEEFKEWLLNFDTNGDGKISKDELRRAIRSRGVRFSGLRSSHWIKEADINHNGLIDDGEINKLVDFAKKTLGMKIAMY